MRALCNDGNTRVNISFSQPTTLCVEVDVSNLELQIKTLQQKLILLTEDVRTITEENVFLHQENSEVKNRLAALGKWLILTVPKVFEWRFQESTMTCTYFFVTVSFKSKKLNKLGKLIQVCF